jgi:hypothetical protein
MDFAMYIEHHHAATIDEGEVALTRCQFIGRT